jgi:hypothetical protein
MEMNLLGEYYRTPDDLFRELLRVKPIKYPLYHTVGTKQGVIIEHPVHGKPNTNCNGFYVVYKYNTSIYVGQCSGKNTIHTRISRFVKTLLENNTEKEDHPAAREFMKVYGNSLAGLSVMIFPVDAEQFQKIDVERVETRLVQEFIPKFNKNGEMFRRRQKCYKENNTCNATKEEPSRAASLEKFIAELY